MDLAILHMSDINDNKKKLQKTDWSGIHIVGDRSPAPSPNLNKQLQFPGMVHRRTNIHGRILVPLSSSLTNDQSKYASVIVKRLECQILTRVKPIFLKVKCIHHKVSSLLSFYYEFYSRRRKTISK